MTLTQIKPAGLSKPVDLADNEKIRLGTGNDLEIYHDGNDSWIKDPGTRHFNFTAGQYQFLNVGANEFLIKAVADGAVELYHNGSKKLETTASGVDVTGYLKTSTYLWADTKVFSDQWVSKSSTNGHDMYIYSRDAAGNNAVQAEFKIGQGATFYHNTYRTLQTVDGGIRVYGKEGGSGHVYIQADEGDDNADQWVLRAADGSSELKIRNSASGYWEDSIRMVGNGAVELNYDNAKKFETSSSGATLQGTLTAQGTGYGSGSSNLEIQPYGQRGYINWTGTENFYFRTGSSYATRWIIDGSGHFKPGTDNTYNLGSTGLRWQNIYGDSVHLPDSGTVHFGTADTAYVRGKDSSDGFIRLGTNGLDRLEINSSGSMRVPSGYIGNSLSDNFTFHGKTQPHYGFNLSASNGNPSGISGYYGLAFATNSLERMRIRQQGGVTFNGDTADANALDDYEEGTATPDFPNADNSIVTVNHYHYTKVGRLVHFEAKFTVGSNNDGSGFGFSLPFGQAGSRETVISAISTRSGTTTTPFAFVVNASQSYAYAKALDGYGHGNVEYTDFAGDVILVSGTYEAA